MHDDAGSVGERLPVVLILGPCQSSNVIRAVHLNHERQAEDVAVGVVAAVLILRARGAE